MKKIFAIALALVMVLSMTSAFAVIKLECDVPVFNWTCETKTTACGKGSVEVVPYVKSAIACDPYWAFAANECAGVLPSEFVYYAIKVTVEANPNMDWWNAASLLATTKNVVDAVTDEEIAALADLVATFETEDYDASKAHVFYLSADNTWVEDKDAEFDNDTDLLFAEQATKKNVEVCVTLKSEDKGVGEYEYAGYKFTTSLDSIKVAKGDDYVEFAVEDGVVVDVDSTGADFFAEVTKKFNLNCGVGTCVNAANLQAIFGWKDVQKDCNVWNNVDAAIVDADCVVAIPKTGDASVVAYAVMAVVAAAGMLKK